MLVESLTGNSQLSLPSPLQLSITISSLLWGVLWWKMLEKCHCSEKWLELRAWGDEIQCRRKGREFQGDHHMGRWGDGSSCSSCGPWSWVSSLSPGL